MTPNPSTSRPFVAGSLLIALLLTPLSAQTPKVFVDAASPSALPNGSSWALAYRTVQEAINRVASLGLTGVDILVAEGVYHPTTEFGDPLFAQPRDRVIRLKSGVRLHGGFLGWNGGTPGSTDPDAPDGQFLDTILSGDIGVPGDATDNCFHVLMVDGNSGNAPLVIDGFVVTGGLANGALLNDRVGAGLRLDASASVRTENVIFRDNYASLAGGAIYATGAAFETVFCTFRRNNAGGDGGAIWTATDWTTMNTTLRDNGTYVLRAGPVSTPTPPPNRGGAVFLSTTAQASASNLVFHDNIADEGAAVFVAPVQAVGILNNFWRNCTFAFNSATTPAQACYHVGAAVPGSSFNHFFYNVIFWDSQVGTPTSNPDLFLGANTSGFVQNSNFDLLQPGTGTLSVVNILTVNPQFVDAARRDLRLANASLCINTGNSGPNFIGADPLDIDLDGNTAENLPLDIGLLPRIIGPAVDMGAHENTQLQTP